MASVLFRPVTRTTLSTVLNSKDLTAPSSVTFFRLALQEESAAVAAAAGVVAGKHG